jgi:hypothetical protein
MAVEIRDGPTLSYGAPSPLFSRNGFIFPVPNARRYAVAPDGRFLMLKAATSDQSDGSASPPQLILVQHWFEELERRVPTD